jgi:sRNA-binding protein
VRQNAEGTVISQGDARIISSADIVEIQRRQTAKADVKRAKADEKKAKADAKKAEAGVETAEADAQKAKMPTKRERKVESMVSTHEPDVEAHRTVVNLSAPYPGRAPVAQMW